MGMLAICWPGRLVRAGVAVIVAAVVAGGLLGGVGPAAAQSGYDEAEAQAIDRMLMCPVCPAQTIDQTEVTLAQQMRAQVRELLAGGASRAETLDWFRERYGPGIVAEPPRSGFNLIAWLAPGAVVIIGLAGGVLAMRAMRRPAGDGVGGGGNIPSGSGGNAGDGSALSGAGSDAGGGLFIPGDGAGSGTGSEAEADELLPWLDAVDRDLARDGVLLGDVPSDDNPSGNEPPGTKPPGREPAGEG